MSSDTLGPVIKAVLDAVSFGTLAAWATGILPALALILTCVWTLLRIAELLTTWGVISEPGERGADGARGLRGMRGERGDSGASGDPGEAGATGQRGERGERGAQGDAGASSGKIEVSGPRWGYLLGAFGVLAGLLVFWQILN